MLYENVTHAVMFCANCLIMILGSCYWFINFTILYIILECTMQELVEKFYCKTVQYDSGNSLICLTDCTMRPHTINGLYHLDLCKHTLG